MNKFLVSEEAYNEFKAFLVENEVENFSIRINLAGFGCSGPAFNITVDEAKEGDVSEKINDITLIAEEKLVDEFGGFRLLSSEENGGMKAWGNLSLAPSKYEVGMLKTKKGRRAGEQLKTPVFGKTCVHVRNQ